jgi:hypothetical protein
MRRIFLVLLALAALAVPTIAGAAACRTADSCKSLEHDSTANAAKTINVDAAGTVLVGGSGSRVELLASGTSTATATAATYWVGTAAALGAESTVSVPAWAHSVRFEWDVDSITIGAGANMVPLMGGTDSAGKALGSATWMSNAAIAAPNTAHGGYIVMGPSTNGVMAATLGAVTSASSVHQMALAFLPSHFRIGRTWTASPTACTIKWRLYGIGG